MCLKRGPSSAKGTVRNFQFLCITPFEYFLSHDNCIVILRTNLPTPGHLIIQESREDSALLRDYSTNGTVVNGTHFRRSAGLPWVELIVRDNDTLTFGGPLSDCKFRLRCLRRASPQGFDHGALCNSCIVRPIPTMAIKVLDSAAGPEAAVQVMASPNAAPAAMACTGAAAPTNDVIDLTGAEDDEGGSRGESSPAVPRRASRKRRLHEEDGRDAATATPATPATAAAASLFVDLSKPGATGPVLPGPAVAAAASPAAAAVPPRLMLEDVPAGAAERREIEVRTGRRPRTLPARPPFARGAGRGRADRIPCALGRRRRRQWPEAPVERRLHVSSLSRSLSLARSLSLSHSLSLVSLSLLSLTLSLSLSLSLSLARARSLCLAGRGGGWGGQAGPPVVAL